MNRTHTAKAALATLLLAAGAHAQLEGTVMSIEQDFSDCLTPNNAPGSYTYGQTLVLDTNHPGDPRTWKLSGPAHQPGYSNSVLCNYAKFELGSQAGTETYFFLTNIDIDPEKGSAQAFNSAGKKIGDAHDQDFGFYIHMFVDDILAGPHDQIVVAWNNKGGFECYPDLNGDGTLDLFDFLQFTNLFNAGDEQADCDPDGQYDLFDFLCYTNAFNAGC